MRLMGKRQLGELELSELVVAVLISNVAAHPLQDISMPLMNGLLPIVTLFCCEMILSGIIVKSIKARRFICGKPSILIANGVIDQKEMERNRFTLDELYEELRHQGVMDVSIVKYAVLETNGMLNVVLCSAESPVTPKQMNLQVEDLEYPMIIINNGRLLSNNLEYCGKKEKWLKGELKSRGVERFSDVYLMTLNSAGQIYFQKAEAKK